MTQPDVSYKILKKFYMDQLIHAFGIDIRLIVSQIINFAILAVALTYFLYKPLLGIINTREEKIAQGMKDAEAAAAAKAKAEEQRKQILSDAQQEAEEVTEKAQVYASEKAEEITHQAQEKAEHILERAKEQSEELKEKIKKETEKEITKLSILAAEKILKES